MNQLQQNIWVYLHLLAKCGVRNINLYPINLGNAP